MKSKEQLYEECNLHLLNDAKPSEYLQKEFENEEEISFPFTLLLKLKKTEQSKQYHPEGNVWNHTMLVVDEAAKVKQKSRKPNVFMWAALLHDIGKPSTTRNRKGKITAYNHDKVGAEITEEFLSEVTEDTEFIYEVAALVKWHMELLYVVKDLPFSNVQQMKKEVDINDIALLGWSDRMGRLGSDYKEEEKNIRMFIQKCKSAKA